MFRFPPNLLFVAAAGNIDDVFLVVAVAVAVVDDVAAAADVIVVAVGQQPVHHTMCRPFVILHYYIGAVLTRPVPSAPLHGLYRVRRP